ncbi:MAG: PQQ-like beta-propeller repeat protein [Acidobacteriota bacterium]|nr:PQQ-like beta-propeller repeat protein [Acidobacteriota bacterium]
MRHPRAFLFTLLLAACAVAQPTTPGQNSPHLFESARQVPEAPPGGRAEPEAFEFELSGYRYRVARNGAGRRTKDDEVRLFNLQLAGTDWIERVYFSEYDDNVVLVCGVRDAETGAGLVARLEQPSMRARWKADLPAFNVGQPLRDGAHLYLTGFGFVAKLDLRTGLFVWRHRRLYGRGGEGAFDSFGPPEVSGGAVLFREEPAAGRPARTLRVHRKSGKILGIE